MILLATCLAYVNTLSNNLVFDDLEIIPNNPLLERPWDIGTIFGGAYRFRASQYVKAIAIFPYYSEAFFNMGNALRRSGGDPEAVIAAYRDTIRFNTVHADARANLALFLLENGRSDEARPLMEELVRLNPRHPALAVLTGAVAPPQR